MQPKWKGSAVVKAVKQPGSYVVQMPGENENWIHAKNLRRYLIRANNVGVIFESDQEFGEVVNVPYVSNSVSDVRDALTGMGDLSPSQTEELHMVLKEFQHVFSDKPG